MGGGIKTANIGKLGKKNGKFGKYKPKFAIICQKQAILSQNQPKYVKIKPKFKQNQGISAITGGRKFFLWGRILNW